MNRIVQVDNFQNMACCCANWDEFVQELAEWGVDGCAKIDFDDPELNVPMLDAFIAKLEYLKACQRENFKREPNHPRNKFDYAVVVPNHPLGYHEHYCMDLEVAKQSAREWSKDYGRVQVEDKNLNTVYAIF